MSDPIPGLIRAAAARGASDLSLEPQDGGALLAVARIDGVRTALDTVPARAAAAAVARLKALASLPGYVVDEAQDGRVDGAALGVDGDLRVAFLPTVRGQRAAVRLPAIGALPDPDGLGLDGRITAAMRAAVRRPDGLVVVSGPTGSGKTTTLHSLVAELAAQRPDRHVLTIEDPVERRLPGVTQVEARPARGLGFAEALAAAMRHDPDVIVVGEVRDPATAAACVRAALTGHLVLTTVHAARAVDVAPRLLEMGVDADLLLPALATVLAQRLVRRRHGPCDGAGCDGCVAGYHGRQAVADLLLVDAEARARLRRGQAPALAADLDHQAASLLAAGATTGAELERVLG